MDVRKEAVFKIAWYNWKKNGEFKLPHGSQKKLAEKFDCHRNTIGNDMKQIEDIFKGMREHQIRPI
ncbi:MAG: hypothetical protein ABEJ95_05670 [Candidatus Nanohalobium sp.]